MLTCDRDIAMIWLLMGGNDDFLRALRCWCLDPDSRGLILVYSCSRDNLRFGAKLLGIIKFIVILAMMRECIFLPIFMSRFLMISF